MNVQRRLEGVAVLAGRAKVQVVGLPLGEVVVEQGARQRRNQRNCRRERNECAECPDELLTPNHTAQIIACALESLSIRAA